MARLLCLSISLVMSKGQSVAAHRYEAAGWSAHSRGECSGAKASTLDIAMGSGVGREGGGEGEMEHMTGGPKLIENHHNQTEG